MNYYNEWDSKAADGLRELIKQGLIPQGVVDTRSINDVTANDLMGFTQCHFFAGIGGWSFALQLAGWPEDRPVWTGSCPCQPFSSAGKRKGIKDDRDLWPVFANLVRECRPEYVFGEQVENAIKHGWLDRVYADLEVENYAVGAAVLGAHSVGAPQKRQRLYWGGKINGSTVPDSESKGLERCEAGGKSGVQRGLGGCSNINSSPVSDAANNGRNDCNQGAVRTLGISKQGGLLESEGTCNCDSMADSIEQGLQGHAGNGDNRNEPGRNASEQTGSITETSGISSMAENPDGRGCRGRDHGDQTGRGRQVQAPGLGDGCGVADCDGKRCNRESVSALSGRDDSIKIAGGGLSGLPPWSNSSFIYCRDEKVRRIPAESILFGVADGVSGEMDEFPAIGLQAAGGFPLCQTQEFAKGEIATLLKQYGNAIVPQVAAEFIKAFNAKKEKENERF